jgi:putative tryptophan/tyrosine transport system substrate-binding protein
MRRRDFIARLGGSSMAWPLAARAYQRVSGMARVGIVDNGSIWDPFRQQLRALNYVEGKNIAFEYRSAGGAPDQLFIAAKVLAQIPVDVISVYGTPAAQATQQATQIVPIVAISLGDPIGAGLVSSLARPGGNITGSTILGPDVVTKRLQLLKDALPSASRVAYLWNPDNESSAAILQELLKAAPLFHMTVVSFEARAAEDFAAVFGQMASDRPDAVLLTSDPLHQTQMRRVIDFLLKNRIPGLFQTRQNVVDGGLMSYGASFTDLFRRGALYVDKILHGTKPGDLPIDQPVTFQLAINLKTAKATGLEFPQMLLARADEVIE